MDFLFKGMKEDASGCPFEETDILKCPFLRNINKPTNFSLSSFNFPLPVRGARGPIFEDGPNFDMTFNLFHGRNGVVPLSENSGIHCKRPEPEPTPQFNPLAGRTATISLSTFGLGGPFGFSHFDNKKNQKKNPNLSTKQDSSPQKENPLKHEASGKEWLETGNCPIAKSYRAVSNVLPLVASAFQLPAGVKLKCPPAIVAARAALARTAFVKNVRPQPLPAKMFIIALLGMAANVPLGVWREHTLKFSLPWFIAVHAAVPFIAMLRKSVLMPKTAMALTLGASILGQTIGARAERHRLRAVLLEREKVTTQTSISMEEYDVSRQLNCGKQGAIWNPLPNKAGKPTSSAAVCY